MKKFAFTLALLALNLIAVSPSSASSVSIAMTTVTLLKDNSIYTTIHDSLKQAYGDNYDRKNSCYKFSQDDIPFCIGITEVQKRLINNQTYLFVMANGDTQDEPKGHAIGGISGLFVFKNSQNKWQLIAQNPNISNGQWGEAQLPNFDLVKTAHDKYGWAGTFEGSGTGETSTDWILFIPVGNNVVETVSESIADNYSGGHWIETKGKVSILSNRPEVNGYYPIQVTRTTKTAPTDENGDPIKAKIKTKNENYMLIFNGKKFVKQ